MQKIDLAEDRSQVLIKSPNRKSSPAKLTYRFPDSP